MRAHLARRFPAAHPLGHHRPVGAVGIKGDVKAWKYDLSTTYGGNSFGFNVKNSANASMGAKPHGSSTLEAQVLPVDEQLGPEPQSSIPGAQCVSSVGAEFRNETFEITAGEPDSYRIAK